MLKAFIKPGEFPTIPYPNPSVIQAVIPTLPLKKHA